MKQIDPLKQVPLPWPDTGIRFMTSVIIKTVTKKGERNDVSSIV